VSFSIAPSIARSFPIATGAEVHQYRTGLRTRVIYPTLPGFILRGRGLRRRHSVFARDHPPYARLCVGNREARADRQCGELVDRVTAGAPLRQLSLIEAVRHMRMPCAGYRSDYRIGIELTAIDAHRAAEAAADIECRLDDLFRARRGGGQDRGKITVFDEVMFGQPDIIKPAVFAPRDLIEDFAVEPVSGLAPLCRVAEI
jgi:hypothetical protein